MVFLDIRELMVLMDNQDEEDHRVGRDLREK